MRTMICLISLRCKGLSRPVARRLFFKEEGYRHIENNIHVIEFKSLDRDLPPQLVTRGLEIGFRYTGQPITCFRCSSTEHVVKDCPKSGIRVNTHNVHTKRKRITSGYFAVLFQHAWLSSCPILPRPNCSVHLFQLTGSFRLRLP